jgi:uncharacterized protein YdeI (YjbR/CyaY-like superfamily)
MKNLRKPKSRAEWRKWLQKNFDKEKEAWVVSPKLSAGKKRIPYNDLVEEALCFGWIDSVNKTLNKDHTMQRFSPRRNNSPFSQPNKERLRHLLEKKLVHPSLRASAEKIVKQKFEFPKDILKEIKKDSIAWKNYQKFSDTYKRIRIAYIDGARKRPEELEKRLKNFITKTRENKLIAGYGGVGIYY